MLTHLCPFKHTNISIYPVLALELYRFNLKLLPERRPHLCAMPLDVNSPRAIDEHQSSVDTLALMDYSYLPNGLPQLLQVRISLSRFHLFTFYIHFWLLCASG